AQNPFRCDSAGATCSSLIDYVSPNATTLSSIQSLFNVESLASILGANNLPISTPSHRPVASGETIRIRFPCTCTNGTGVSDRTPVYTVVPNDGLYHIAAEIFSGLVTYPEIQAANGIANPQLIYVGQKLWIPLPCSCAEVDGREVVHYGHVVAKGSTVAGIAQQFGTAEDTLLKLNNLSSPQDLLAGAVLDVPLAACNSSVYSSSPDYPLLIPNDTYAFTAGGCVRCACNAASSWNLQCSPSSGSGSCPASIGCPAGRNSTYLGLGNSSISGCDRTTCAYAGYHSRTVLTTLDVESTC
ncbi:hypothetical protein M569_00994, partial [Genlisea aurea]